MALERTAVLVKVPIGNPVLHRDDARFRTEQLRHVVGHRIHLVGLDSENHDVLKSRCRIVRGRLYVARHEFGTVAQDELDAPAADRIEVRPAGEKRDPLTGKRQFNADVAADGPGPHDCDLHQVNLKKVGRGNSADCESCPQPAPVSHTYEECTERQRCGNAPRSGASPRHP